MYGLTLNKKLVGIGLVSYKRQKEGQTLAGQKKIATNDTLVKRRI